MANDLSCYEQAARKADERGAVPALWANAFADSLGEPKRTKRRYRKFREPSLGAVPQGGKIVANAPADDSAPAPVEDGKPQALTMSGEDFYRAACFDAHVRLMNLP